jgi:hypothetical protein
MHETTSETSLAADSSAVPDSDLLDGPTEQLLHWILLGLSVVVMMLAFVLQVRGEQVVIPVLDLPVPGTCTFKAYVGADCPGCGLTRCFVSMAHGQVSRAWHYNPVGILFFAIVATQLPYRAMQIWRMRRGRTEVRLGWWGYSLMLGIAIALIVQWVLRWILVLL